MHPVVVGIADCQLSNDPESVLVTYALGSCIAVVIYDPVARVAGMLHLMLPDSSIEGFDGGRRPHMFADTGIPWLFRRAYAMGAEKKRLQVRLAGGAQVMDDHGVFDIGKRNYTATRKILWKSGIMIQAEAVGGTTSRTVRLETATGTMWVREGGGIEQELGTASRTAKGIGYGVPTLNCG